MKNAGIILIASLCMLVSCKNNDPIQPYAYETNPHYSFGYQEYYGAYFADYGIANNVISLSLFSDSLKITEDGRLAGFGQYLFLEDVYVLPTQTSLTAGTYTIDKSGLLRTVSPGVNDTIDNEVYTYGATISYFEKDPSKSVMKRITGGTFTLSTERLTGKYTIAFNFTTSDGKPLKGSFSGELGYSNESLNPRKAPLKMDGHLLTRQ